MASGKNGNGNYDVEIGPSTCGYPSHVAATDLKLNIIPTLQLHTPLFMNTITTAL